MLPRALVLASSLALGSGALAQVPFGHFVVSTRSPGAGSGAWFVDPVTRDLTPVLGLVAPATENQVVTVDPTTGNLYTGGAAAAIISTIMYQMPMSGRNAAPSTRVTWTGARGMIADAMVSPQGGNMLLAIGGSATTAGLWSGPLAGGVATQLGSAPDAVEVAADLTAAYILTHKVGVPSTIWRYDFVSTTFALVVGGLPEAKAFDLFPAASRRLLVGTQAGDLQLADATTNTFVLFRTVGQGPIAALRMSPTGDVLFATDGGALFTLGSLPNPLGQLPRVPTDIDVGTSNVASFFTFGSGCAGSGSFVPAMNATGLPSLGNATFAFSVSSGPGGAPAIFALGNSRRDWGGIPLPFDLGGIGAPGCEIAAKGILLSAVALGGSGPGNGTSSLPLPIPNQMALVGTRLMTQWWILDPPANALGLTVSDGGEAIVR